MQYQIRQKFWAFGDDFTIKDEQGRDRYMVDGRAFSFGDSLSLQDMTGRELLAINQKLLSWGPTYEITQNGTLLAIVKKKLFTFLSCQFMVDVPGPDDLTAEGDLFDHEYTFTRHGRTVASVSKRYFTWTDTYGLNIHDGEDDPLLLASVIVIDLVCHDSDKR